VAKKGKKEFQQTLFDIQERFGVSALRKSSEISPHPALMTGYSDLDEATGINGLPIGHLTAFVGQPTSGKRSLAYRILAQAHRKDNAAIYVDLSSRFDPDFASVCGVDLNKLLLVRPAPTKNPLALIRDLLTKRSAALIVLDATDSAFIGKKNTDAWRSVIDVLRASPTSLILLGQPPLSPGIEQYTSLQLHFQRQSWIEPDITGYQVQVTIQMNKFAPAPRNVALDLVFDEMQRGDR
jgi:hypothetical protein